MDCPICGFGMERRFCRVCGNDSRVPVDWGTPGVSYLIEAYDAASDQRQDHAASISAFRQALKYTESFPSVLGMVTWFEYAMSLTKSVGGPPKNLPASDLSEFIRALEKSKNLYEALSEEAKKALLLEDYPNLFRGNLADARRAQGTPATKPPAARSASVAPETTKSKVGTVSDDGYTFAAPSHMFSTQLQLRVQFPGTDEGLYEASATGIRCLKCIDQVIPLKPCPNCGHGVYALGLTPANIPGLFCHRCNKGFTSRTCSCGCDNPVNGHTLMKLKTASGGCLIATAASGDANSIEVLYLTDFRDSVLAPTFMGSRAVSLYYAISPKLAGVISRSRLLRNLTLWGFVRPIIGILRIIIGPR
jgi:hypothetical protein